MKKLTIIIVLVALCQNFIASAQSSEGDAQKRSSEMMIFNRTIKQQSTKIGLQEWMVKNLDVIAFRNGDKIRQVHDEREWRNAKDPVWCYVWEGHPEFGKFYNYLAIRDKRGLAPEGWRIPSLNDWETLYKTIGGTGIDLYKLTTKLNWPRIYTGFTNITYFYALPLGTCTASGVKTDFSFMASFWASTSGNTCASFHFWAAPPKPHAVFDDDQDCGKGMPVRCIRN